MTNSFSLPIFSMHYSDVDSFCAINNCYLVDGIPNGSGCSRWIMLDNFTDDVIGDIDVIDDRNH